jgi:hypothetical protein
MKNSIRQSLIQKRSKVVMEGSRKMTHNGNVESKDFVNWGQDRSRSSRRNRGSTGNRNERGRSKRRRWSRGRSRSKSALLMRLGSFPSVNGSFTTYSTEYSVEDSEEGIRKRAFQLSRYMFVSMIEEGLLIRLEFTSPMNRASGDHTV